MVVSASTQQDVIDTVLEKRSIRTIFFVDHRIVKKPPRGVLFLSPLLTWFDSFLSPSDTCLSLSIKFLFI